jgi:hypothetical protein
VTSKYWGIKKEVPFSGGGRKLKKDVKRLHKIENRAKKRLY